MATIMMVMTQNVNTMMTTIAIVPEIEQKVDAKNYCEIENENKDHSRDNENVNDLACENFAQNQNDVASIDDLIFGLT